MATKPFDPNLLRENDKKAKNWVKELLPPGYMAVENTDKYGVDLLIYKDGKHVFNIEPEIKRVWKSPEAFPWDSVQVPVRKSKVAYLDKPTLFIVFRNDGKEYLCIWGKALVSSEIKEIKNIYVRTGELFFCVKMNGVDKTIGKALKREWKKKEQKAG